MKRSISPEDTTVKKKNKKESPTTKTKQQELNFLKDLEWEVTADDPGIFINFAGDNSIHMALSLPGVVLPVGLVPGANPAISAANLKAWLVFAFSPQFVVLILIGF